MHKFPIFFVLTLSALSGALKAGSFEKPLLSPDQAVLEAEGFVVNSLKVDLNKYNLYSVGFYHDMQQPSKQFKAAWWVSYECKPDENGGIPVGCFFSVEISNDKKPEFSYHPGY